MQLQFWRFSELISRKLLGGWCTSLPPLPEQQALESERRLWQWARSWSEFHPKMGLQPKDDGSKEEEGEGREEEQGDGAAQGT